MIVKSKLLAGLGLCFMSPLVFAASNLDIFTLSKFNLRASHNYIVSYDDPKPVATQYSISNWYLINKYVPKDEFKKGFPKKSDCNVELSLDLKEGQLGVSKAKLTCSFNQKYNLVASFDIVINQKSFGTATECASITTRGVCSSVRLKKGSVFTVHNLNPFEPELVRIIN